MVKISTEGLLSPDMHLTQYLNVPPDKTSVLLEVVLVVLPMVPLSSLVVSPINQHRSQWKPSSHNVEESEQSVWLPTLKETQEALPM